MRALQHCFALLIVKVAEAGLIANCDEQRQLEAD